MDFNNAAPRHRLIACLGLILFSAAQIGGCGRSLPPLPPYTPTHVPADARPTTVAEAEAAIFQAGTRVIATLSTSIDGPEWLAYGLTCKVEPKVDLKLDLSALAPAPAADVMRAIAHHNLDLVTRPEIAARGCPKASP